jgi:hypothetical protein
MTKTCKVCLIDKPYEFFSKDKSKKNGLQRLCKQCDSKKGREYHRNNKEKKETYYRLRKGFKKYQRMKYKYNLTDIAYDQMIFDQEGKCAICGSKDIFRLCVDHDHNCCSGRISCGKCVRGLLCNRCNLGLGGFDDDISKLLKALDYLLKYEKNNE